MAANVETMFYTREKPWHGLGTRVLEAPNSKDVLRLAGLDWNVVQEPIYTETEELIDGYKANVRDADRRVLGVVTDRCKVIQNDEAFAFTDALLGEGVRYESAGSLQNGKKVWLYPFLYLFSNKMAVLKIELPLVDVETDALKDNELDKCIQSTTCTWDEGVESFTSLEQIEKFYKDKIYNNIEFVATNDTFRHIIMTDYLDMPNDTESLSKMMKEDIFRIVCAPAPRIPGSIKEDAEGLLKNYSWGKHNMKSVLKSTGGCVSFVDIELFDYRSQDKYEKKMTELQEMERVDVANILARDVEVNVEFAILIIIMKKLNQRLSLWQKQNNDKEFIQIQKDYYENVIFIDSIQEACYGSVSEQVCCFEKMLPHYMKSELMTEKINAVESILEIEKNEKEEKMQKFITVGGFLLNVIFGLPSIYGALGILREFCSFVQGDIPIVSKTNVSVIIWLLLNVWMYWKIFINRQNASKR